MKIFLEPDYKAYLRNHINSLPKSGRGQLLKIARFLRVHPTLVSQVLKGDKNFSPEQAKRVAEYLGLSEVETRYLVMMVLAERAGSTELREHFEKQMLEIRNREMKSESQLKRHKKLEEEEAKRFYSSWKYSAARLLISIPRILSAQDVADHLSISLAEATHVIRFLLGAGLIAEKSGRYEMAEKVTFLDAESPMYQLHHMNWRLRSFDACSDRRPFDFTFTSPMVLSRVDFERIRNILLDELKAIGEIVTESPSEVLACLNIDFFKVGREI